MTLVQAVRVLRGVDEGDRRAAWRVFYDAVSMAAKTVRWGGKTDALREDVTQEAAVALARRFHLIPETEGAAHAYVRKAVFRAYLNTRKKPGGQDAHERLPYDPKQLDVEREGAGAHALLIDDDPTPGMRALLGRLIDHAEQDDARHTNAIRPVVEQLWSVDCGETTVEELVVDELGCAREQDPKGFVRIRDRLHQQHQRARRRIRAAGIELCGEAKLSEEEKELLVLFFPERQIPGCDPV